MFFSKRFTRDAAFLIGIGLLFFLLRFPSLYEPYWYGDEGIYFTIGEALHNGRTLYVDIWDNKPPMLYWFYFLFSDIFSIRFVSLLFGILASVSFFILSKQLFRHVYVSQVSTFVFATALALPTIEGNIANAENFMLFPIIVSVILFWKALPLITEHPLIETSAKHIQKLLFAAGLLLGVAFLFKTVAVFDLATLLTTLLLVHTPHLKTKQLAAFAKFQVLPLFSGFFLPLLFTALIMLMQGALPDFLTSIFLKNVSYVGENNALFFPQGLLLLKLFSLIIALFILYLNRTKLNRKTLFILIWLAFSLFNAFFSQRPYTHYQLVVLPALFLLFGVVFDTTVVRHKIAWALIFLLTVLLLYNMFPHWNMKKTLAYYENFLTFVSGQRSVYDYQRFFDGNTPRDYAVSDYLKLHTDPSDTVFLWGNSAQIYYLSDTLPAGRYAVSYHIVTPEAIAETAEVLKTGPKFLVILPGTQPFPLSVPQYAYQVTIGDADIYERLF